MKKFSELLKDGTVEQERKEMLMRYKLADACLEEYKTSSHPGRTLYAAFSHLAQVRQLEINMAHFDNIMFASTESLGVELFYQAQLKLKELEDLLYVNV